MIYWVPDHKDYQELFPQIAHFGQADSNGKSPDCLEFQLSLSQI